MTEGGMTEGGKVDEKRRGRGRDQNWRTQRISTRLRLKSKTCALDVRSWLENAIWGLKPNTVIARLSSVAPRMRVWSLRGVVLSAMNGYHPAS